MQLMEERVYFSLQFQNTRVHNCVKTWHPEQEAERSHLPLKTRSGEQTGSGVRQSAKCVLSPARLQHPVPKSITNWGLNVQMPEPTGWELGAHSHSRHHHKGSMEFIAMPSFFIMPYSLTFCAPAPVVFNL